MRVEKPHLIGLGAFALLAAGALAMRSPEPPTHAEAGIPKSHVRLAALSTEDRKDVDYAAIDRRLQKLMDRRAMVGMAVGIV